MTRTHPFARLVGVSALVALQLAGAACERTYLKEEPPAGEMTTGKIVYVDDGSCPQGQVK
jgi:hypothetical protein